MDDDERQRELKEIVNGDVTFIGAHAESDLHDESLHVRHHEPFAVARPHSSDEVAQLLAWATRHDVPVTPRGSGTGLSGGATPVNGGLVVCFDQMRDVLRVDVNDHVAVVQAGITLRELNEALLGTGLHYPVYPGELSGSLGGNVNTNAGGMRAVRHGVTRQHVLGLEVVLMDGTVMRTGGPVVKSSSGYDLTQLLIGSEGTLALVTEVTLKLSPVFDHSATMLVAFSELRAITSVVPALISSGLSPSILEYLDVLTMSSLARGTDLQLGVSPEVAEAAAAYLIVVFETRTPDQLEGDLESAAMLVESAGALDVYVLAGAAATQLIEARERAFWLAKAAGANDIIDVVVPRSTVPTYLETVSDLATRHGAFVAGCGHVGDGNVHLSVFQPDEEKRDAFLLELFREGLTLGGAISGEHGLGVDKRGPYLALADPDVIELQRKIKHVFDPKGLLNPFRHLDARDDS
ncbi:MAG TPA: FAD-linked oxidase C-terminal domain-containing protein [Acidimicrobiales bacterium]|jgi:glycolate oxidase|nr:FAD-linked oxidase C-terminal domain-containing protein [Acidimicrobiales bacterium]